MKLDRNITSPRRGKYALIKLRLDAPRIIRDESGDVRVNADAVDFGNTEDSDFFVIRLKDKYAGPALTAYAVEAEHDDPEYAKEIYALADKAKHHPNRKMPD